MSATIPTISEHGREAPPIRRHCPMADCPGQYARAIDWLITTTRADPALSAGVRSRPAIACIPIRVKYSGVTPLIRGLDPPGLGTESRPGMSSVVPSDAPNG